MQKEMYGELPSELKWEFVHVHAVHLTEAAQKEIMANVSENFTVDGYVMVASNAANSYVKLLPRDGPFMICAIVVAFRAAHVAS